jgi:hypothetical protein
VHGERIGLIGDAASGELGLYVAALDQRFVASAWDARQMSGSSTLGQPESFSLAELIAAVAPRALRLQLPADATIATSWQRQGEKAAEVFRLRKTEKNLVLLEQADDEGEQVYAWLENRFRR